MKKLTLGVPFVMILLFFLACSKSDVQEKEIVSPAQEVINKAIEKSGGELYQHAKYAFDFRDRKYIGTRNQGKFSYERIFSDSTGDYRDIYFNEGFVREFNGKEIDVIDSMAFKYTNSINSVFYFALLPFGLNDPAVNKRYLGIDSIRGKSYHEVEITFDQQGGGKDFEDVFVYWINEETFFIDYFGYTYKTDGGGARFRRAFNPRIVEGIRFQDYENFKPSDSSNVTLSQFDSLYELNKLEKISEIVIENLEIEILK